MRNRDKIEAARCNGYGLEAETNNNRSIDQDTASPSYSNTEKEPFGSTNFGTPDAFRVDKPSLTRNVAFRPIGQRRPAWFYSGLNPAKHMIYDRLLAILEDEQLTHLASGVRPPYILIPETGNLMKSHGTSELGIAQGESMIVNILESHPHWEARRVVPPALYHQLKRAGRSDEIFEHRIVPVPGLIHNALLCEQLLSMFERTELLSTPGFFEVEGYLRLDLDPKLARQGFIVPIIRGGLIDGLKVFRWPGDTRPFRLCTREVGLYV